MKRIKKNWGKMIKMNKKFFILSMIVFTLIFNCSVSAFADTADKIITANISSDEELFNSPRLTWQTVKVDNYFDENEGVWKTNIIITGDHLITKDDLDKISYFIDYDVKRELYIC